VLDLVWEHLLPALEGGREFGGGEELSERLADLVLAPCPGAVVDGARDFVCVATEGPVAEVRAEQCSDGSGDWLLTLAGRVGEDVPGDSISLRLAPGDGWRTSGPGELPAAVSGGWTDAATLRFDVLFLETPHRMYVTCDVSQGTVEAHFINEWLGRSPLTSRRAPND
jgi:hypothetical protein